MVMKQEQKNIIDLSTNQRHSKLLGNDGFTLLEVMFAMLILLIGMLTFFQLLLSSIKINQANKQFMVAQEAVSQEIELVKTIGYTGIKSNSVLTSSNFGYSSSLASLPANYQISGIDTSCNAPASYCVYKGLKISKTVNGTTADYFYTLKLAVDPGYLTYPALAQVDSKVYWKVGNTTKNANILAFVGL
jgi:prepilin-type N-terminal cleavage/methylation domain-containing protein